MGSSVPVTLDLHAGALRGGRPGWAAQDRTFVWADIGEPALHLVDPATREATALAPDLDRRLLARPGRRHRSGLVMGLYHINPALGEPEPLAHARFDTRRFSVDDGRRGTGLPPDCPEPGARAS